jgi:hypothetical protein
VAGEHPRRVEPGQAHLALGDNIRHANWRRHHKRACPHRVPSEKAAGPAAAAGGGGGGGGEGVRGLGRGRVLGRGLAYELLEVLLRGARRQQFRVDRDESVALCGWSWL